MSTVTRLRAKLSQTWKHIRAWRRLRFTPGGAVLTLGAAAVGFAAVNTGNNLLHLLLGATLGLIAVSGWFSERTIRDIEVRRETPRGVTAGQEVRIAYQVRSRGRFPAFAVEISEAGLSRRRSSHASSLAGARACAPTIASRGGESIRSPRSRSRPRSRSGCS